MIIDITAGVLADTLKKISICCKTSAYSVLRNVHLSAKGDTLTAYASNINDLTMRQDAECTCKEVGSALVDLAMLLNAAGKLKKTDTMHIENANNSLQVSAGRFKLNIPCGDLLEYPPIKDTFDKAQFTVIVENADDLKAAINRVAISYSTDMTRAEFTGIYMAISGRSLNLVSTDGHRLTLSTVCVDAGQCKDFADGVIVPGSTLATIVKGLGESIRIGVHGNEVLFTDGASTVALRIIPGQFPDFTRVIPDEHTLPCVFEASRDELQDMTKRIMGFAKKTGQINLTIDKKDIHVSTFNDAGVECEDAIELTPATFKQSVRMGLNGSFLLGALAVMTCDYVRVGCVDMDAPLVVKDPTRNDQTFIIMPMQI